MFEHRRQALLPRKLFYTRLARSASAGLAIIFISLSLGISGYHFLEGMHWLDAFVNAAMILSGMGPVGELHTGAGKLFAGFYALYSGLALITTTGIVFAPVFHRFLHKFHVEAQKKDEQSQMAKSESRQGRKD
jgi:hypothetical protein